MTIIGIPNKVHFNYVIAPVAPAYRGIINTDLVGVISVANPHYVLKIVSSLYGFYIIDVEYITSIYGNFFHVKDAYNTFFEVKCNNQEILDNLRDMINSRK